MTNKKDLIWAAGYLSGSGSFVLVNTANQKQYVRLTLHSRRQKEAILKFADVAGVNVADIAGGALRVVIAGEPLHRFITATWDYLTDERKREYAGLRKQIA